jgi:hypothetical protein
MLNSFSFFLIVLKFDELVKSPTTTFTVIPAPHQVRDKLQRESSLPGRDRTQTGNYAQLYKRVLP